MWIIRNELQSTLVYDGAGVAKNCGTWAVEIRWEKISHEQSENLDPRRNRCWYSYMYEAAHENETKTRCA